MADSPKPVFGKRKSAATAAPAPRAPFDYKSGAAKAIALLDTDWDDRDERWHDELTDLIQRLSFYELSNEAISPEGHRVYPVGLAEAQDVEARPFSSIVYKATDQGMSVAVFTPGNTEPRFVFKLGQLIPYLNDGKLLPLSTRPAGGTGAFEIPEGTPVITAHPGEKILPPKIRTALREWLDEYCGVTDAKICLRTDMLPGAPMQSMAFDFGPATFDDDTLRNVLRDLYWYMHPEVAPGVFSHIAPEQYQLL